MKILSYKSFGMHSSSKQHRLFGVVFAPSQRNHLPTTISANNHKCRFFGKYRLLSLLQLLSLFALIFTIIVYSTLSIRTHSKDSSSNTVQQSDDAGKEYIVEVIDVDATASEAESSGAGAGDNAIPQQHPHKRKAEMVTNELKRIDKKTISANLKKKKHHHHHNQNATTRTSTSTSSAIITKDEVNNNSVDATGELYYDYGGSKTRNREQLDNVFFSVKSTKRFHSSRLDPILKTWFNLAKNQTWFFTDDDDPDLAAKSNGHLINTHCPSTHYRQALCCKMSSEFDTFLQTSKSWFCHFDDDNYVNVPGLLNLLGRYNAREYWYLGKPSLKSPIRIKNPDNHTEEVSFWFATGGAGFCLSRALALRMSPLASGGKFMKACDKIQLPDDVTMGYIAGHLLGQNLTVIPQFHSHFETMKFIDTKNPSTEITFSYVRYAEYQNTLDIEGLSEQDDPTRFLSLHCQLFPRSFAYCSKMNQNRILASSNTATTTAENEYSGVAYYRK